MIIRTVVFGPEALEDIDQLFEWVAEHASADVALAYVDRLQSFCDRLAIGSLRGTAREDIRQGLRTVGFERNLTVAFAVDTHRVEILRVFAKGRDWEGEMRRGDQHE